MNTNQAIPAAQYVRMSTEHQQYPLENQSLAIQSYAQAHGFEIVRTYSDAAKSGLVLTRRAGLQQLLKDAVGGDCGYKAILVYDVSRWGRFQDTDEAAHYEFLCKSAGVPVHYCAEIFTNDGTLSSLIMKALKRTMAGEYSRELGVKVIDGMNRLTMLGFKQGGIPGYGLRRMLVSASGVRKQELAIHERKSISTDRVILVPGPPHEVQVVKDIYRMFISEKRSTCAIARKLNADGVQRPGCSRWDFSAVRLILRHPKYAGFAVHGQTTGKLFTPRVKVPRSKWIVKPGAFEAIIDPVTFAHAQRTYSRWNSTSTNEEHLEDLRALLASAGRLSTALIRRSPGIATPSRYCLRFGSLRNAYKLIGYSNPKQFDCVDTRIHMASMRDFVIEKIAKAHPSDVSIIPSRNHWRKRFRVANGPIVCVLVARTLRPGLYSPRWRVYPVRRERKFVTLLVRLDKTNSSIFDMFVFPNIDRRKTFEFRLNHPWLTRGKRLRKISQFCKIVRQVQRERSGKQCETPMKSARHWPK